MATLPTNRNYMPFKNPLDTLPRTKFPTRSWKLDYLHDATVETAKEREVILNQPYRTTPLITPGAKTKPHVVNNNPGVGRPYRRTLTRPLETRSVVANLDDNRTLVHRQFNSPHSLYSEQNVADAMYQQGGVKMYPTPQKPFNPDCSPTFHAILEEESYNPARLHPAPYTQQAQPPFKYAHPTSPSNQLNSIGQPTARIAQSDSFRRLMLSVMMSD